MKYLKRIIQFLFPIECVQCELSGTYVCEDCMHGLRFFDNAHCFGCGVATYAGKVCHLCRATHAFEHIWIAAPYDQQILRTLIWQCKYQYVADMAASLGALVARSVTQAHLRELLMLEEAVLVPMPAHRRRMRQRGFNQAELIAQQLSNEVVGWHVAKLVERVRHTKSQLLYSKDERMLNVRGAFAVVADARIPQTVIIIDDVVTTGSSLNEVARVLRDAGVKRVLACVVARRESTS